MTGGLLVILLAQCSLIVIEARSDKGLLVNDAFLDAAHYWPFDNQHGPLSMDIITGHNAIFMDGAEVSTNETYSICGEGGANCVQKSMKGSCATTQKKGSYIIAGNFKGTCFCDPGKCILGGMSISIWVKLDESLLQKDQDAYILSSGGQSKKSRGFAFLYFHGTYVFIISTKDKQWKMTIPAIPNNKWVNAVFTWDKHEELVYYMNGERKQSVGGKKTSRPDLKYAILTISRPNNALSEQFMYPLKVMSLALWDKALNAKQVKNIYTAIKGMKMTEKAEEKKKKYVIPSKAAKQIAHAPNKKHNIAKPKDVKNMLKTL